MADSVINQNASSAPAPTTDNNAETSGGAGLTFPDGILMLSVAVLFDIIGLIPVVGDISDIFAGLIIGGWMLTRRGGRKALRRFLTAFILGLIPIVSDITPFISLLSGGRIPASWIGCVYLTLKDG